QLALQDVITFETGLFALIGVNAGAGFLPILTCLGLTGPGARVVQVNLIARLFFAAIAVFSVLLLGPSFFALTSNAGISLLWFHVGLNFTLAAVLVHVTPAILDAAGRIFPSIQREPDPRVALRAIYLNENDLKRPDRALLNITRELLRAADTVHEMLTRSIDAFQNGNLISKIRESDEIVDSLHRDITVYISRLMREQLSEAQASRARALFDFSTNLEHIGDIIDHNLMELARSKKSLGVEFSDEGWHELSNLHSMLIDNFRLSLNVVMSGDVEAAEQLLSEKRRFRNKAIKSQTKHFKRLLEGRSDSLGSSVLHLDVLRDLRRVSSHLTSAAYPVLDTGSDR
ncbi:MAG: PhoU domain-containing protein, partial [Pseudomonadota bacterium]